MNALVKDPIAWTDVGAVTDVPLRGSRRVPTADGDIAIFRTGDGRVFALRDRCPHKGGPLSQGIVHGHAVTCPLHNWSIELATGEALAGPTAARAAGAPTAPLEVREGRLYPGSRV